MRKSLIWTRHRQHAWCRTESSLHPQQMSDWFGEHAPLWTRRLRWLGMEVVLGYEDGWGKVRGDQDHQGEREKESIKKMDRPGKLRLQCGFDFSCQSSALSENQSHMNWWVQFYPDHPLAAWLLFFLPPLAYRSSLSLSKHIISPCSFLYFPDLLWPLLMLIIFIIILFSIIVTIIQFSLILKGIITGVRWPLLDAKCTEYTVNQTKPPALSSWAVTEPPSCSQ